MASRRYTGSALASAADLATQLVLHRREQAETQRRELSLLKTKWDQELTLDRLKRGQGAVDPYTGQAIPAFGMSGGFSGAIHSPTAWLQSNILNTSLAPAESLVTPEQRAFVEAQWPMTPPGTVAGPDGGLVGGDIRAEVPREAVIASQLQPIGEAARQQRLGALKRLRAEVLPSSVKQPKAPSDASIFRADVQTVVQSVLDKKTSKQDAISDLIRRYPDKIDILQKLESTLK